MSEIFNFKPTMNIVYFCPECNQTNTLEKTAEAAHTMAFRDWSDPQDTGDRWIATGWAGSYLCDHFIQRIVDMLRADSAQPYVQGPKVTLNKPVPMDAELLKALNNWLIANVKEAGR